MELCRPRLAIKLSKEQKKTPPASGTFYKSIPSLKPANYLL